MYSDSQIGFLYLMMGVIISSAVLPATLTLLWTKQNKWAAMLSPPLGLACSLIAWLVTAQKESGELSVASLGANFPMLAGNVVALLAPCIFVPVLTFSLGADNYNWESMAAITKGDDHDLAEDAGVDLELVPGEVYHNNAEEEEEQRKLLRASKIAKTVTVVMTVALLLLWPIPMYGTSYIFSREFFTGWVVVGIIWLICSLICVGLYPLWEGRKSMWHTLRAIFMDATGKEHPSKYHGHAATVQGIEAEGKSDGLDTPPQIKGAEATVKAE
jgi:Na+/proline symporter